MVKKRAVKNEVLNYLSEQEPNLVRKKAMPASIDVMLATLTQERFSDSDWIFERKLDGERCIAFKKGDKVILKSRNDNDISASYPEIVQACAHIKATNAILDGEVVAFSRKVTSFSKLQHRFGADIAQQTRAERFSVYYYVFDLIYLDGYDLTQLPLITRKKLLKKILVVGTKSLRYTTHLNTHGVKYYKQACIKKWEGIIAKRRMSTYVHKRSTDWLKFKCVQQQELVIGGYTDPQGSRIGFGALLLGYYKNGKLQYAGNVGTGFDEAELQDIFAKLKKITTSKNPFTTDVPNHRRIHFVRPVLVAEIGFTEWTHDNKLRHPSFLGLRRDKKAREVVQEL